MQFSKLPSIIKIILLKIVEEIERRIQEKNENKDEPSFANSVFTSLKFIVIDQVDHVMEDAVLYVKKQIDDLSLILARKISIILASLLYIIILLALFLLVLIFLLTALSLYLGDVLGSNALGFLSTALIVVVFIFVMFLIGQNRISSAIQNYLTIKLQ